MSERISRTIRMRGPGFAERIWHHRLGTTPPVACGSTGPRHADWVRLLPYRWKSLHRGYAAAFGFFWLPCILCNRPYGGHQSAGTIPDPTYPPDEDGFVTRGTVICPVCTKERAEAGLGTDA